jgi:hypothetical protein
VRLGTGRRRGAVTRNRDVASQEYFARILSLEKDSVVSIAGDSGCGFISGAGRIADTFRMTRGSAFA